MAGPGLDRGVLLGEGEPAEADPPRGASRCLPGRREAAISVGLARSRAIFNQTEAYLDMTTDGL
jgi:hypothetical protein